MTVGDLIAALSELDPSLEVWAETHVHGTYVYPAGESQEISGQVIEAKSFTYPDPFGRGQIAAVLLQAEEILIG